MNECYGLKSKIEEIYNLLNIIPNSKQLENISEKDC